MKNQKGVTLIALVITIIVLLILAGISIAMLMSDDSIAKNGSKAEEVTFGAELKEELQRTITNMILEGYAAEETIVPIDSVTIEKLKAQEIHLEDGSEVTLGEAETSGSEQEGETITEVEATVERNGLEAECTITLSVKYGNSRGDLKATVSDAIVTRTEKK